MQVDVLADSSVSHGLRDAPFWPHHTPWENRCGAPRLRKLLIRLINKIPISSDCMWRGPPGLPRRLSRRRFRPNRVRILSYFWRETLRAAFGAACASRSSSAPCNPSPATVSGSNPPARNTSPTSASPTLLPRAKKRIPHGRVRLHRPRPHRCRRQSVPGRFLESGPAPLRSQGCPARRTP